MVGTDRQTRWRRRRRIAGGIPPHAARAGDEGNAPTRSTRRQTRGIRTGAELEGKGRCGACTVTRNGSRDARGPPYVVDNDENSNWTGQAASDAQELGVAEKAGQVRRGTIRLGTMAHEPWCTRIALHRRRATRSRQ